MPGEHWIDCPEFGPLSILGYHVGERGGNPWRRHEILRRAFEEPFPWKVTRELAKGELPKWGTPRSSARLEKMIRSLGSFSSNAQSRKNARSYRTAIREWQSDAQWLRAEHGLRVASRWANLPSNPQQTAPRLLSPNPRGTARRSHDTTDRG